MKLTLLKGRFTAKDLEKVLTDLIQVKIKYHEDKIKSTDEEESIKMRETRIISLQNDLRALRAYLTNSNGFINVESDILISTTHGKDL